MATFISLFYTEFGHMKSNVNFLSVLYFMVLTLQAINPKPAEFLKWNSAL